MHDETTPPGQPLNGWKEIAAYVGKSVRSVQRWETTLGLPVHRIRTRDGQIVYADKTEIDDWRRKLDAPSMPEAEDPDDSDSFPDGDAVPAVPAVADESLVRMRPSHAAAIALMLIASGSLLGWRLARPSPVAVSLAVAGRSVQGLNHAGAVVWSYPFDRDVSVAPGLKPTLVSSGGSGVPEWLVPVSSAIPGAQASTSDALYAFTQDGEMKWTVRPDQKFTFSNRTMSAPWMIADLVVTSDGPRRIWLAFAHHTGGSSFVLEIDEDGAPLLRYYSPGRIYTLAHWKTPSGGFLAVGGASDERRRPTVALMPENDPPASLHADDPRRTNCAECPRARPQRVLIFPSSELTTAAHALHPYVQNLRVVGPTLKVVAYQGGGHSQFVVNSDFTVGAFQFTQSYWGAHKQLELKGRLDHAAETCPDRFAPAVVREWTPALGWREWRVQPGPQPST